MSEENYEEIKPKTFSFGVVGDFLVGTLLDVTKSTSPDKYGKYSNIYQVKAKEGSFYGSTKNEKTGKFKLNDEPTVIANGEEYNMWVNHDKGVLIGALKDIKLGQKFKVQFVEEKPTDKGNPAKIIKVFAAKNKDGSPAMDKEYLDSKTETLEEVVNDLKEE